MGLGSFLEYGTSTYLHGHDTNTTAHLLKFFIYSSLLRADSEEHSSLLNTLCTTELIIISAKRAVSQNVDWFN